MKRIIICCDGTWNEPGTVDKGEAVRTNVQKIYESVAQHDDSGIAQLKYYISGVGTSGWLVNKIMGGATGEGIDNNIKEAYKFLIGNYEKGDEIYLFGFSRGAYTARSLAGLVRNSGVLKPEYFNKVDEAYKLYRSKSKKKDPDSEDAVFFKNNFCIEEPFIKFIGIWDTVGALGVPLYLFKWFNRKLEFHDVTLSSKVLFAYHALAIDERRKAFAPTLWEQSKTVANDPSHPQKLEQVWFPGVHSNVGGGYKESGLSDITLKWMIEKAKGATLSFNEQYIENQLFKGDYKVRNSITGIYHMMRKKIRDINRNRARGAVTNEYIHYSCFEYAHKYDYTYKPKNVTTNVIRKTLFCPLLTEWNSEWMAYLKPEDLAHFTKQSDQKITNIEELDTGLMQTRMA
ncbi:hypothetical protein C3K47_11340 [Solitalea longa]|uniref:T6SS Phospholipase effector Tle1-like catalytic domain-containing protein n=1 Tax=Solitalea longa TaxID=2079460 RepID=A0A2S5A1D6_9SPHI|nr:DUF2235 domain-containing protein [Solitalea longa]POY36334.1 hypothetical protein C3K47_11340 [Solitalea longa]